jgi:hypothetical protein
VLKPSPELAAVTEGKNELSEEEYNHPNIKEAREGWTLGQKVYDLGIYRDTVGLTEARQNDATLCRLMEFCASSWRLSATMLRQELIDLPGKWEDLGMPGKSPYAPSKEEPEKQVLLLQYLKEFKDLGNTSQTR